MTDAISAARRIADEVLFPSALDTDRADLVPVSHLDLLARERLYGIVGPVDSGGLSADVRTFSATVEALAGGCLSTTFVWIQHHSVVRALAETQNRDLRASELPRLCRGEVRSGIALGGLRAGPHQLRAKEVEGGWLLSGGVPFVTGWARIDVIMAAALTSDGRALRALVDARDSASLHSARLPLAAANASGTVSLAFDGHFVPAGRVISVEPYRPPPSYDGGGRPNGSLALGVADRCCRLMGPSPVDTDLDACRRRLDEATPETMAEARAAASALAVRAAARLAVHAGSSSLLLTSQAQRLYRESLFLLVFGTRPAIRASLLDHFAPHTDPSTSPSPPGGEGAGG